MNYSLMPKVSRSVWFIDENLDLVQEKILDLAESHLGWLTTRPDGIGLKWDIEHKPNNDDKNRPWHIVFFYANGNHESMWRFESEEMAHEALDDMLFEMAEKSLNLFNTRDEAIQYLKEVVLDDIDLEHPDQEDIDLIKFMKKKYPEDFIEYFMNVKFI